MPSGTPPLPPKPPTTTDHRPLPIHHLTTLCTAPPLSPASQLLILTPASVVLPTPTGVFLPTFLCGGALGRAAGLALIFLFPSQSWLAELPGHFAVAGAAAMTTAATRTLSTAVVTLELSGVLALQPPLLVAGTVAFLVSRALEVPSLSSSLLDARGVAESRGVAYLATRPKSGASSYGRSPPSLISSRRSRRCPARPSRVSRSRRTAPLAAPTRSDWLLIGCGLATDWLLIGC